VAEPLGDGVDGLALGDQPGGVGVAQVVEVQPVVLGPERVQLGALQQRLPDVAVEVAVAPKGAVAALAATAAARAWEQQLVPAERLPQISRQVLLTGSSADCDPPDTTTIRHLRSHLLTAATGNWLWHRFGDAAGQWASRTRHRIL